MGGLFRSDRGFSQLHKLCDSSCIRVFVAQSGYWQNHQVGKWEQVNAPIVHQIRSIHAKSKQTYGSPRITRELARQGWFVSRPRVARLMKQAGIRSILRKKYVRTTDSTGTVRRFENLLDRNFAPGQPGRAWVSDITYIATRQGWSYLTTIIDLGDRKVIGWRLSRSLRAADTVLPAWRSAVSTRPLTGSLILHSDQGVQSVLPPNSFIASSFLPRSHDDTRVHEGFKDGCYLITGYFHFFALSEMILSHMNM
jgi:putative transposase